MEAVGLAARRFFRLAANILLSVRLFRGWLQVRANRRRPGPPLIEPVVVLPRAPSGPTDDEVRARFAPPHSWYHEFRFEGGLDFPAHYRRFGGGALVSPLGKFRHSMPDLVAAAGGAFGGKRVLDIACNAGFWSFQCAMLGAAEVVGFDGRKENIDSARFVQAVTGLDNVRFQHLLFEEMTPERLGGRFDIVLNLGVLYHLPEPIEALRRTAAMAREFVLLDTRLVPGRRAAIHLQSGIRSDDCQSSFGNLRGKPSKSALLMFLHHLGLTSYYEIPPRRMDVNYGYLTGSRIALLIDVRGWNQRSGRPPDTLN